MEPNTRVAILGPNGCGKTSLLKVLLGLQTLDSGQVGISLRRRDLFGAVLQNYRSQLLPWASVKSNLLLPIGSMYSSNTSSEQVLNYAERFLEELGYHIPFSATVRNLSGGQQQALILARALAFKPDIYIWDEPTSAIDFSRRGKLYKLLNDLWRDSRATVIMTTHNLDEAIALSDRVLVFDSGMRILLDVELPNSSVVETGSIADKSSLMDSVAMKIRTAMAGEN